MREAAAGDELKNFLGKWQINAQQKSCPAPLEGLATALMLQQWLGSIFQRKHVFWARRDYQSVCV